MSFRPTVEHSILEMILIGQPLICGMESRKIWRYAGVKWFSSSTMADESNSGMILTLPRLEMAYSSFALTSSTTMVLTTAPGCCNLGISCVLLEGYWKLHSRCQETARPSVSGLVSGPWEIWEERAMRQRRMVCGPIAITMISVTPVSLPTKARRMVSATSLECGSLPAPAVVKITHHLANLDRLLKSM